MSQPLPLPRVKSGGSGVCALFEWCRSEASELCRDIDTDPGGGGGGGGGGRAEFDVYDFQEKFSGQHTYTYFPTDFNFMRMLQITSASVSPQRTP